MKQKEFLEYLEDITELSIDIRDNAHEDTTKLHYQRNELVRELCSQLKIKD